jgi:hypothetical protein
MNGVSPARRRRVAASMSRQCIAVGADDGISGPWVRRARPAAPSPGSQRWRARRRSTPSCAAISAARGDMPEIKQRAPSRPIARASCSRWSRAAVSMPLGAGQVEDRHAGATRDDRPEQGLHHSAGADAVEVTDDRHGEHVGPDLQDRRRHRLDVVGLALDHLELAQQVVLDAAPLVGLGQQARLDRAALGDLAGHPRLGPRVARRPRGADARARRRGRARWRSRRTAARRAGPRPCWSDGRTVNSSHSSPRTANRVCSAQQCTPNALLQ